MTKTIETNPVDILGQVKELKEGDVLVLADGTYAPLRIEGVAGVQVRAANRYRAIIAGGVSTASFELLNCPGGVVDGLQITGSQYDGIGISRRDVTIENCWVHHNAIHGIAARGITNLTIRGCLVEWNGCSIQFAHGICASGTKALIENNVVRHNSGMQIGLCPTTEGAVVRGNLLHDSPLRAALWVECRPGWMPNMIIGNTIAWSVIGIHLENASSADLLWLNRAINCPTGFEPGAANAWANKSVTDHSENAYLRKLWPDMGTDLHGYPYAWRENYGEPLLPPNLWNGVTQE